MSESAELNNKLEETKAMLAELAAQMTELVSEESKVNYSIREKYREINQLNSQKINIENKKADFKTKLRDLEETLKKAEKDASRAAENERVREEFLRLSDEYDTLAEKFNWNKEILKHQKDGAKKLAIAKRAVLGDKRGLGKTLTAIAYADLVGAKKILAIVPNDVMGNFEREIRYWAPHRGIMPIGGLSKIARNALLDVAKMHDDLFVIVNYEAWRKDNALLQKLIECQFDTVIADEAHMIKEMGTNAYKGVEKIVLAENQCCICGGTNFTQGEYVTQRKCYDCQYIQDDWGDFCSVKHVLPMTGTPILNKPQDIFPLLHLVNPRMFRDKQEFLYAYCVMNSDGKWVFKPGGAERLATKLSGMYVARDRYQAGVKIPKQTIQVHELTLDKELYPEQWQAYKILTEKTALVVNDMLAEDENKAVVPILYAIALITRERQMATWPAGIKFRHPKTKELLFESEVTESIKVDYICDRQGNGLVPQFVKDEQERVVVFSQFKEPLKEIERRLKGQGISVVRYDGDTSPALAQEVQMDFDRRTAGATYKWDVVLAHYKKGGVGLNLNAATQTILLDEEWNPGKEDQAHGRTDRMGQTEETTVHVLRILGTVDIWMAKLIQMKADMIEGFETQVNMEQELLDILRGAKFE